ncbi:hypothetical protein Hanom_Chr07g00605681 [Helianthus anomalus]
MSFPVRVSNFLVLRFFVVVMANPSKPPSPSPVNSDPPSLPVAEEEMEVNAPDKFLPVLKWSESAFNNLITSIQMPTTYGGRYPQEGDTASDTPAGYVSMFADWFEICNLRLPLTIFMVELLEYYNIHISQLSHLGMICARNFEYTFRAQNVVPMFMTAPKGLTKWKTKFFNVKVAAFTARLRFTNVTDTISTEQLSTPEQGNQAWLPHLHIIPSQKYENRQLQILRMMLRGKPG